MELITLLLCGLYLFIHWLWEMNADRRARGRGFADHREEEQARFLEECWRDFDRRHPQT